MSEEQRSRQVGEKQEKQEEKDEKGRGEKSWDEKWRRDPLNAAVWALILIWGGLVLLASNIGLLKWLPILEAWPIFFVGAGGILLLEVVFRLAVPAYRAPLAGTLILAIIFLGIGLGNLVSWWLMLGLILIALGVVLLFRGFLGRRQ